MTKLYFSSKNDRKITLENITNNCKQTAESGSKRKQTAEFGFKNVNKQLNLVLKCKQTAEFFL